MGKTMGIHSGQLTEYVIQPALAFLGMTSPAAEELLLGTACQESRCGHYLHQLGKGPAVGIFQMEPATYRDIRDNWIQHRPVIKARIVTRWGDADGNLPPPERMITDLQFAAVMCRLHYRRVPAPLPAAGDINAHAGYWKRFYNTIHGRGTEAEYLANWRKYSGRA